MVDRCAVHRVLHEFVLHLKGIFVAGSVVGIPVNDVIIHQKAPRKRQRVFVDIAVIAVRIGHPVNIGKLRMTADVPVECNISEIQHRIHKRHIAVVNIAVHTVDGISQLAHESGCHLGVARGKHRQTRVIVKRVVVAGLAGQQLHAAAVAVDALHIADRRFVRVIIRHEILALGKHLVFVEGVNHDGGIGGNLREHQRHDQRRHSAFFDVLSGKGKAQQHRVADQEAQTRPDDGIGVIFAELLLDDQQRRYHGKRAEEVFAAHIPDAVERLRRYRQHDKADEEGIAVGQVVGEMEAVESKIRPVICQQQHQNAQQSAKADAGSQPDLAAEKEKGDEEHRYQRAIDIGQVVAPLGGRAAVERAGEDIPEVEILLDVAGKLILRAGGFAQGNGGGNKNPHRKQTAHNRRPDKPQQLFQPCYRLLSGSLSPVEIVALQGAHEEPQHHKNAYHIADIVIGRNRESEGDAIKKRAAAVKHFIQTVNNQRQQHKAVQPHHVPRIGDEVGRQRIGDRKPHGTVVFLFENALAKNGKGRARRGDFQHLNQGNGLGQIVARKKQRNDIEGAAQIIGDQRKQSAPHAHAVRIRERVERPDLFTHQRKEGGILVMHINNHHRFFPEGINAQRGVANGYRAEGQQRCHPDVIMPQLRHASLGKRVTHDQRQNARRYRKGERERHRAFIDRADDICDQHNHEEGQHIFQHRHDRLDIRG